MGSGEQQPSFWELSYVTAEAEGEGKGQCWISHILVPLQGIQAGVEMVCWLLRFKQSKNHQTKPKVIRVTPNPSNHPNHGSRHLVVWKESPFHWQGIHSTRAFCVFFLARFFSPPVESKKILRSKPRGAGRLDLRGLGAAAPPAPRGARLGASGNREAQKLTPLSD